MDWLDDRRRSSCCTLKAQGQSRPRLWLAQQEEIPAARKRIEGAGVKVAGVEDIAAMKMKVIMERGALRDYFDLMEFGPPASDSRRGSSPAPAGEIRTPEPRRDPDDSRKGHRLPRRRGGRTSAPGVS